jgi:hypothetical protein
MQVCLGVGLYAWFDYSAESLVWHKRMDMEAFDFEGKALKPREGKSRIAELRAHLEFEKILC